MENKRVIFQWITMEIVQCACDDTDNPIMEPGLYEVMVTIRTQQLENCGDGTFNIDGWYLHSSPTI
jgi:hypothetical protein